MIVTCREDVVGREMINSFGIVSGNIVCSRVFYKDIMAGVRRFLGWEVKEYTELLKTAREKAMSRMVKQAHECGANAVVSVRFETNTTSAKTGEIMAYGTAVLLG